MTVIAADADCPPPVTVTDALPTPAPVTVTAAPVVELKVATDPFPVDHVRLTEGIGLFAASKA